MTCPDRVTRVRRRRSGPAPPAAARRTPPPALETWVLPGEVMPLDVAERLVQVLPSHPRPSGLRPLPAQPEHLLEQVEGETVPLREQGRVVEVLALGVPVIDQPHHLPGQGQRGRGPVQDRAGRQDDPLGRLGQLLAEHEVQLHPAARGAGGLPGQHHAAARHPLVRPDVLAHGPGGAEQHPVGTPRGLLLGGGRDPGQQVRGPLLLHPPRRGGDHEVQVTGLARLLAEPQSHEHAPAHHQCLGPPGAGHAVPYGVERRGPGPLPGPGGGGEGKTGSALRKAFGYCLRAGSKTVRCTASSSITRSIVLGAASRKRRRASRPAEGCTGSAVGTTVGKGGRCSLLMTLPTILRPAPDRCPGARTPAPRRPLRIRARPAPRAVRPAPARHVGRPSGGSAV